MSQIIESYLEKITSQNDEKELILALKSKTEDLGDASQIECANKAGNIDFIITRDKKGFKNSMIDVLNPDELILLSNDKTISSSFGLPLLSSLSS